ncbi:MAG: intradiol ring-cleavage dioxygenase [Gemmatimonadaceae bacterium]
MTTAQYHSIPSPITIDRRAMLGRFAGLAATVVVSQTLTGCGVTDATSVTPVDTATSGTPSTSCVLTASLTEGPYFVDEKLERSDIRSDPTTGAISQGVPLALTFNVSRVSSSACTPLTGAYLDVWHCDAAGTYSDVTAAGNGSGGAGRKFLRGYQLTDANGVARFTTIYPGWYSGRAVHIHFKLRLFAGSTRTYEFTSQFFFDETRTDAVHALSPYNSKGTRNVRNTTDNIYNSLSAAEKTALTLQTTRATDGYSGVINLGVAVG